MSLRAAMILVGCLGVASAGCGEPFTLAAGSGGAGGAGHASSATGTSSTTSVVAATTAVSTTAGAGGAQVGTSTSTSTSGTGGAPGCTNAVPDCGMNAYCKVASCAGGSGTCEPLPPGDGAFEPLCGCDGDTYFSPAEAVTRHQAIVSAGECGSTAHTCTIAMDCTDGYSHCSLEQSTCSGLSGTGKCWVLPDCTMHHEGAHACNALSVGDAGASCESICTLIETKTPWVRKPSCISP